MTNVIHYDFRNAAIEAETPLPGAESMLMAASALAAQVVPVAPKAPNKQTRTLRRADAALMMRAPRVGATRFFRARRGVFSSLTPAFATKAAARTPGGSQKMVLGPRMATALLMAGGAQKQAPAVQPLDVVQARIASENTLRRAQMILNARDVAATLRRRFELNAMDMQDGRADLPRTLKAQARRFRTLVYA